MLRDFAAIDFETANGYPSSVCSVGIVVVRGGRIVDRFYSLIQPEPNYYSPMCVRVHGLTSRDTDEAPIFPRVWEQVEPLIEGLPLVAHNSRCTPSAQPSATTSSITITPLPTQKHVP